MKLQNTVAPKTAWLTFVFLLQTLLAPAVRAGGGITGDWFGSFARTNSRVFVIAHFSATKGTVDIVDEGNPVGGRIVGKPLINLVSDPSRVHFEVAEKAIQLSFDGQATDGVMTGSVKEGATAHPLRLDLMALTHSSRYAGIYQVGPGHFIEIRTNLASLFSFDTQTAQMRILLPRTETDFICGPGMATYPVEVTIHFTTNETGEATGMQWKPKNGSVLAGVRTTLPEKEVSFTNGETTLSGTLVMPPGKGLHPAVVLIHGSGPGPRSGYRFFADFFALNGVATLAYDKRGCGKSTGDWRKSGFDDLSGDALAGLEMLRHQPGINPRQIGVWGISQGGWLVGLAAARSTNVAFVIGVSGPGITPEAQGAFMVEHRMKTAGFSEAELREALALYEWNSRCSRTGSGWDEFNTASKAAENKPWYNGDVHPYSSGEPTLKQWQLIWDYDPVPVLRQVHCPVLAIFGDSDPLVPAQKSAEIWKRTLKEARNRDVTVKLFPHADHGISDTRTGIQPPEFFTLQRDWILRRFRNNSD